MDSDDVALPRATLAGQPGAAVLTPWLRGGAVAIIYLLPAFFVIAPLAAFLISSFWHMDGATTVRDFSFGNYAEFYSAKTTAGQRIYTSVFGATSILALKVMFSTVLVGYAVAYFIHRSPPRLRYSLLMISIIPMFMSYIIKLYAIRSILGFRGFLNKFLVYAGILDEPSKLFLFNLTSVQFTLSTILLPFAILPIYLSLERIPRSLSDASADLGGGWWQTFRRVTLPLSLPGVLGGGLFTYILALGDFVTPQMVGGTRGLTFGRVLHSQFGMAFNWPFGATLAMVLLVVSLAIIVVATRIMQNSGINKSSPGILSPAVEFIADMSGRLVAGSLARVFQAIEATLRFVVRDKLVYWVLALVTLAAFAMLYAPVVLVGLLSFFESKRQVIDWGSFSVQSYIELADNKRIFRALTRTMIVAFFASLAALVAGTTIAYYYHTARSRLREILQFAVFMPFLLPPIITGLSMLVFFREVGISTGLIAVVIGHTAFVMALVYRTLLTRIQALSRALVEASKDLGASGFQTFRYVVFPHMRSAAVTAAILAFVISFDETLITLFLVGDTSTLPIRLWAMMRTGFSEEINALVTIIIVASGLLTLLVASRLRLSGTE
jgi:spermidine/putrescine transport system permease protein